MSKTPDTALLRNAASTPSAYVEALCALVDLGGVVFSQMREEPDHEKKRAHYWHLLAINNLIGVQTDSMQVLGIEPLPEEPDEDDGELTEAERAESLTMATELEEEIRTGDVRLRNMRWNLLCSLYDTLGITAPSLEALIQKGGAQ